MTGGGYAGDIDVRQAWQRLGADPGAVLVDVRTRAEWSYVGLPDLAPVGREIARIEWQSWPSMDVNGDFVGELATLAPDREAPVLFICRSGVRSIAAAVAATAAGWTQAFNVSGGFEGPHDAGGHRGTVDGWKAAGLPWSQG